jgi:hypothetical protein
VCRSRHEPGGPARCPSHARARFADALAEVLALEARELELYRQASARVADLVGPVEQAQAWYRQAQRTVEDLRMLNAENDIDPAQYRQAYRDMRSAQREADKARQAHRPARDLLERRRREAVAALSAAGLNEPSAERILDDIDIDTTLQPPFT